MKPLTDKQFEFIAQSWKDAYSEDIAMEYPGFWQLIGGPIKYVSRGTMKNYGKEKVNNQNNKSPTSHRR